MKKLIGDTEEKMLLVPSLVEACNAFAEGTFYSGTVNLKCSPQEHISDSDIRISFWVAFSQVSRCSMLFEILAQLYVV